MEETFVIFISVCLLAGITGKPARRCCSSDTVPSCLCLQDEDLEVCQFEEQVPIIEVRGYCKCSIIYHEGILSTPPVVVNSERATCSWNCKSGLCSPFEDFTTTTTATYPTGSDITKDTTTAYLSSTSDPSTSEDPAPFENFTTVPFENFTTTTTATYPTASDITKDTTTAYLSSTSDPSTSEDPVDTTTSSSTQSQILSTSYIVLIVWVAVVTVILITLLIYMCYVKRKSSTSSAYITIPSSCDSPIQMSTIFTTPNPIYTPSPSLTPPLTPIETIADTEPVTLPIEPIAKRTRSQTKKKLVFNNDN
ncbi:unnamed protein product [Mytilus coruscus]|uniref:Uncharacterized protein n=1 Tax=Mytilus coruscus TaxID=42192 RepID=A0A6J8F288_MYTCO|nr:unnamed protein product [Mytilus coruscus]